MMVVMGKNYGRDGKNYGRDGKNGRDKNGRDGKNGVDGRDEKYFSNTF
jgi:hypothetical protein